MQRTPHAKPPRAPAEPAPAPARAGAEPLETAADALAGLDLLGLPADPLDEFFYGPGETPGELAELVAEQQEGEQVQRGRDEVLEEFLGFHLAQEEYAVELARIREIVKVPPITEIPRAPAAILGIMSLRGEVMPVYDLHRLLGLPKSELSRPARVMVVDVGDGPVGVLVDAVAQVLRLRPSGIEAPPPGLAAVLDAECLRGIGRQRDRMFILLRLNEVLRASRARVKEAGR